MTQNILHIGPCDKFIPPFIEFVKDNFDFSKHEFLLSSSISDNELISYPNVKLSGKNKVSKIRHYASVISKMRQADKIILHGLFDIKIVQILFFSPWLLKKCYWIIWGGDLYVHKLVKRNKSWYKNEFFRRPVVKNMGNLVTYIEGDVDLAKKWYKANGKYHECLMYSSNLYKDYKVSNEKHTTINIQVGNSADPSNNHIEALEKLLPYKDDDIYIYVPLSYGNSEHAGKVIKQGKLWFGDKFIPLIDFMPFDEYLQFLGSIDIAVFNHKRQQAMGNTITLLGLGKVIYMRSDTTQWEFFKEKNILINDIDNLGSLNTVINKSNIDTIKDYFSQDNYKRQLGRLF
tara:strand:- start:804 stop:1838 length:1035 start_codon:yes stop_codon:yes gene_type:complete